MNKNRHRIVFNASRGQRMAVAEVAASHGGASRAPVAMAMAVFLLCAPTHAQVVADPNAPGHQRPTILQTGNGLPQINIQTPSAAGVSRNTFRQFDIQSNGAVINNSRTNTGTQLGGFIAGNPWLATGEARVVLNEVNSSHPSHLNGYIEVAGRQAEVIIANPAGIQVNGGGFINASGVTLTTGTPVMNGGQLESFRIQGGSVRIDGLGLDASTADYTTILARALEVNAALWAKELTVVAGSNEVKALARGAAAQATRIAGTGTAPVSMLDVAALGGMYAGKIYLVGTEAGLGVNNRGSLIAQEGEWVLQVDGSLVNTGRLQAKGDLSIQVSGAIGNTGSDALISSQGNTILRAGGALDNTAGTLLADGALALSVGDIDNRLGIVAAGGDVRVTASDISNHQGTIASEQRLQIDSAGLNNHQGLLQARDALDIDTQGHLLTNTQGMLVAGGHLLLAAGEVNNTQGTLATLRDATIVSTALNNDKGLIQAAGTLDLNTQGHALTNTNAAGHGSGNGGLVAGVAATLATGAIHNTDGAVLSDGTLDVVATGAVTNLRGRLQSVGGSHIEVQGSLLDNTAGRIASQGVLTLKAGDLVNGAHAAQAGVMGSQGDLTIQAAAITNGSDGATRSNIWSAQRVSLSTTHFTNAGLLSGSDVSLTSTSDVMNNAGASIESSGNLNITATATVINAGQLIANDQLRVAGQDIGNRGSMEATDHRLLAIDKVSNLAGASITASNSIDIDASTFSNRGVVNANDASGASQVHIRATTVNNLGTGAIFGDRVAISAVTLNNRPDAIGGTAPVMAAREQMDMGVQTLNNEDGALLYSGGSMAIGGSLNSAHQATGQAQSIHNLSADIDATDRLLISTDVLANTRRNVSVETVQVLDQSSVLTMPSWWVNGQNSHGAAIEGTSNYRPHLFYLLDPASILSDTPLVTPDGNVVRRIEVALTPQDSIFHAAVGAFAAWYGVRERVTVASPTTVVLFAQARQDGIANPDQVTGAPDVFASHTATVSAWQRDTLSYTDAYGRCTTQCTMLTVQPGYTDPQSTILRDTQRALTGTHPGQEVARTAQHTIAEDRLNADAGLPASIRAGGNMRLDVSTSLTNRFADIQAGATLDLQAAGGSVVNEGQTLKRTHRFLNTTHTSGQGPFNWTSPDISEVIGQAGGTLSGAQQLSIAARNLTNTDLQRTTGLPTTGLGFLGVSLPAAHAPITLPDNALYQPSNPGSNHLIQGAPAFTGYRSWLGSEYLIANLGADPHALQKRLGDGFYEQKLIREQVAQLTGRRFLQGYSNEEAQYRALMDSGVALARTWNLVPGVALTAEQMAQLTTDLVWLVERDVILPDGSKTTALVPQLYVRQVPEGDYKASGALLAGNQVSLQVSEDLVNAGGRIEGGVVIAQAGRDLNNIGGLMQARSELLARAGRNVTISSPTHTTAFTGQYVDQGRTQLAAIGEMRVGDAASARLSIEAGGNVALQAARVGNASTSGTTRIQAGGNVELQTAQVGSTDNTEFDARNYARHSQQSEIGTSVQGAGDITIQAGNDVTARAASVNAGADLNVKAGNDITLEAGRAVSESASSTFTKRSGLLSKKSNEEVKRSASDVALGSSFSGDNLTLEAGQDVVVKGGGVNAQDLLLIDAGRDVVVTSEQSSESGSLFMETKKSGFSVSKQGIGYGKSAQDRSGSSATTRQEGSTLSGGDVLVLSGRDTHVEASTVVADDMLGIAAGRDVSIVAGVNTETRSQASNSKSKGVNLLPSGLSPSVTILHDTRQKSDGTGTSATAAASSVGSLGGDVTITAGQEYRQTGSDVLAVQGDVDIQARSVEISEAREARSTTSQQSSKSTVLGATPRNALVDAIQSTKSTAETAQATTQTGNRRAQALGTAATALSAYNTASQVAALVADPGKIASVTIDVSLSSNKSQSQSIETLESGRASAVAGAGDVRITATGAGTDSDLLIRGSDVSAGRNATLKAEGDVRLESSQDESTLHSTSKSSGVSIGVGISFGASTGVTLNASANKARGNADGEDVVQRNTHVTAGNTARIESDADTTLAGATVSARHVQSEVGGNLSIESRQDTGQFKSDQSSSGFGVSLCIPPICYGTSSVSVSGGEQNVESEFTSVIEQSGIRAGDGGFQVNVQGDTTLKGGSITSTDKAVQENRNTFATGGELTMSDVQNYASYEADGYSVNVAVAVAGAQPQTPEQQKLAPAAPAKNEGSAGIGEDSGEASSTTQAAISGIAGNTKARTGDTETGIAPIFDRQRVQQEIDAQIKITASFGQQAAKAIGAYAANQLLEAEGQQVQGQVMQLQANKARNEGREQEAQALQTQAEVAFANASDLRQQWGEHGSSRVALHTLAGALSGGASGAAGAASSTLIAPRVGQLADQLGLPEQLKQVMVLGATSAVGALAGGDTGAAAAINETSNNYLTSAQQLARDKELAACNSLACTVSVKMKYGGVNALQDAGLVIGVGGGIGYQTVEQASAIVEMVKNLPETLQALNALVSDPEFRAKVGEQLANDYKARIEMQTRAYNDGGWDGSVTAGVEAGRLAVDIVGAATAVMGAGKVVVTTAKAGSQVIASAVARTSTSTAKLVDEYRVLNNVYRDGASPELTRQMFDAAAKTSTRNPDSAEVVLGKYVHGSPTSYEKVAQMRGATYFEVPDWIQVQSQLGESQMWSLNKAFLEQQIAAGKKFLFTSDPTKFDLKSYGYREYQFLNGDGYKFQNVDGFYHAIKQ